MLATEWIHKHTLKETKEEVYYVLHLRKSLMFDHVMKVGLQTHILVFVSTNGIGKELYF